LNWIKFLGQEGSRQAKRVGRPNPYDKMLQPI
jgi:hypothetical protein